MGNHIVSLVEVSFFNENLSKLLLEMSEYEKVTSGHGAVETQLYPTEEVWVGKMFYLEEDYYKNNI